MQVKSLQIYPVKSGQGINLQTAQMRPRGLAGDRRFMLVGEDGLFITQRIMPKLAGLYARVRGTQLTLSVLNIDPINVDLENMGSRQTVTVWRSTLSARRVSQAADEFLSAWLNMPVSLVFMDELSARAASPEWASAASPVSFADGYPVLITNTASLDALNSLILSGEHPAVLMNRFRPNIVIDSAEPWGEDNWGALKIGGAIFDLVKPCTRCIMTTLDQTTGEKQGREPLQSLRALRTSTDPRNEGVLFGMNAVPRVCGEIGVGDKVSII